MTPLRPEVLTPERSRAWRPAARELRRGEAGRAAALAALTGAGYSADGAAAIVRTMIAQGTA